MRYIALIFIIVFLLFENTWSINLSNELLIAKPDMKDERFRKTVIVMLFDNDEGAAGLVVNKPLKKISMSELLISNNISPPKNLQKNEVNLYWGGPVKTDHIFFIHSSDYKSDDYMFSNEDFIVTQSSGILSDIAENKGPEKYIILLGISAWNPGQLNFEMQRGDWKKKFNTYLSLFENEINMWERIINSQDI